MRLASRVDVVEEAAPALGVHVSIRGRHGIRHAVNSRLDPSSVDELFALSDIRVRQPGGANYVIQGTSPSCQGLRY
jgi:hypothetical protein